MDLAQYRELEAFAKFGSDLDKATLAQLRRGSRLVELLKQGQYKPMSMERQVVSLFAGTNGYLDEIPLEKVQRYEAGMLEMMDRKHAALLQEIAENQGPVREDRGNAETGPAIVHRVVQGGRRRVADASDPGARSRQARVWPH